MKRVRATPRTRTHATEHGPQGTSQAGQEPSVGIVEAIDDDGDAHVRFPDFDFEGPSRKASADWRSANFMHNTPGPFENTLASSHVL